ncbi:hypothetical protein NMY22_g17409 [Coprinellus aureogranulatus]|nr:hypothetical protein NMY22_g17409 [Coprinellus aureogranulatus]
MTALFTILRQQASQDKMKYSRLTGERASLPSKNLPIIELRHSAKCQEDYRDSTMRRIAECGVAFCSRAHDRCGLSHLGKTARKGVHIGTPLRPSDETGQWELGFWHTEDTLNSLAFL